MSLNLEDVGQKAPAPAQSDDNAAVSPSELEMRVSKRFRGRIVTVAVPAALALVTKVVSGLYRGDVPQLTASGITISDFVSVMMLFLAFGSIILWYLQTGLSYSTERILIEREIDEEIKERQRYPYYSSPSHSVDPNVAEAISRLHSRVDRIQSETATLNSDQREDLIERIHEFASQDAAQRYINNIKQKFERDLKRNKSESSIEDIYNGCESRLRSEIRSLGFRGNLNLVLGSLTTITGLTLLGYFVVNEQSVGEDAIGFARHFLPRISLVIIIQVFAFFFLRLYKSNLSEIKYYQNEITSISQMQVAIQSALRLKNEEIIKDVISVVSKTDRNSSANFLISQQQEHDRSLIQTVGEAAKNLASALPGKA